MIRAEFFKSEGNFTGFQISGHSGYADSGSDIVCASVSSAVQLSANLITDGFSMDADVSAENNVFELRVKNPDENSEAILNMLRLHLKSILEEFPKTIKITIRRCNL
ncbi:MAG: ribosomal-processing cysteine protease Prp [Oscillospiraceae bacterium]|nr:ribosomal-processing cysteine protease Prp [Oscillospiraceae bacterium]